MTASTDSSSDVLIVGAGPAGLALAAALADAGLGVCVLEQAPRAAIAEPAEDGREIALTHRARAIMERLGLWSRVPAGEIAPLVEARVLDGDSPAALRFMSQGTGLDALGWLIPNHLIRAAALGAAEARAGVQVLSDTRVTALDVGSDVATVTLADGRRFGARLVVAADSRFSQLRRLAGIGASHHDFARSVVVGRLAHDNDSDGIAWECFRYGNTLALLPLNGRRSSAVVTVAADRAPEWLALDDAAFAARVEAQAPSALGRLSAAGPRHHYPLVGVYAHRFSGPRFALVGDAAVGMHPVTAHGYNFGLYGVEVLARELAAARGAGRDIGSAEVLARYANEHRRTTLPTYLGTNAIVKLFTDEHQPAKLARKVLLTAAEKLPPFSLVVKAAITRQLTGRGPAVPRRGPGRFSD
ncbi:MAG: 5-demethoxyubiquinol-8 5-hydroxylase UbiM [Rubrivivax sp.]|nr:5-demethoxyubiquinol-8 5-hydroxylase UbiM [Rubrivivax sp.]MCL4698015.1 5-demethoxyubiquinol-8 5-hydroxylase UbiM [Burkholderiaceae bacterium]